MAGRASMAKGKAKVLLNNSDSEDDCSLKINENYAERYDKWRGKEELQKYTARYGEEALKNLNNSDEEDSTSTEEDEDARELTVDVEKQFFKTLACLKKGDPRIYDSNTSFFKKKENAESGGTSLEKTSKAKKEKPMFLRDYERKMLLENGGKVSSDEEGEDDRPMSPTFVQEQRQIRDSFKNVLQDESDEDEGLAGLFMQKKKTKQEEDKEEDDYRQWLKGQKEELGDKEEESDLGALKSYWTDPKLESGEAFLRDYILNKRYLEFEEKNKKKSQFANDSDSGDEKMEEEMEQFEHKYNFRFEEPDQEFLKRYPRTMTGSMRQKDERRKVNREEVKERKAMEKEQKRQELQQLKAIKRKEIEERLQKLKEVTGNANIEFEGVEFDEDFDPDKHDKKMQSMFNEDYYEGGAEEEEKPEFPDLDKELELENWDEYEENEGAGPSNNEPHCEDPDFNMDCEYNPKAFQKEMLEGQTGRKKKKKRSKLAELLAKKKPQFDRESQEINKYMDEYYGLDYEDIVGDQPCRFKYRPVVANSYGLTVEEILMADDKELNRWCSLKKTCQYKNNDSELFDVQAYDKKGRMEALKRKILPSLYKQEEIEEGESSNAAEGAKKKKKKKKSNGVAVEPSQGENASEESVPATKPEKPVPEKKNVVAVKVKQEKTIKRKRKQEKQATEPVSKKQKKDSVSKQTLAATDMSDARLKAYGINPKKFKNKIKYGKK